jgi:hypothetical protein
MGRGGRDAPQPEQTGQADRDVYQEDPRPATGGDEHAAEGRAECRSEEEQQSGGDRDAPACALLAQ